MMISRKNYSLHMCHAEKLNIIYVNDIDHRQRLYSAETRNQTEEKDEARGKRATNTFYIENVFFVSFYC